MPLRPTIEKLRRLLTYDPETGEFHWLVRLGKGRPGKIAGSSSDSGRIQIMIGGIQHKAQNLAWALMTGEWPTELVDHKNRNCADNRWCNLRAATDLQNRANSSVRCTSRSGIKGVRWHPSSRKWWARIRRDGREQSLGYFHSADEAGAAYRAAARDIYGEFAI